MMNYRQGMATGMDDIPDIMLVPIKHESIIA
jgi:hypothetical protein